MPPAEPRLSADDFRAVFRGHPAGVAVITLDHDARPFGFTVTSVISVSAEPPLLAFAVSSRSRAWTVVSGTERLAVNFLGAHQAGLAARFATRGIERFDSINWSRLDSGEPVLAAVPVWLSGRVIQRVPAGSSQLVVVEALQRGHGPGTAPLIYHDRAYHPADTDSAL